MRSACVRGKASGSTELLACFARWSRVHAHLAPYVRHLCDEAVELGLPAQRPLFLHYAEDASLYAVQDQYLYGADLVVAPVIEDGARARAVMRWLIEHGVAAEQLFGIALQTRFDAVSQKSHRRQRGHTQTDRHK